MSASRATGWGARILAFGVLLACGDGAKDDATFAVSEVPRFAAVSSDRRSSSSVHLLDAETAPLATGWLASNTVAPGLSAALDGDVTVVGDLGPDGAVTVIGRLFSDVVTRISVPDGTVVGQLRLRTSTGQSSFSSNPQDAIIQREDLGWVTRFETNFDPTAGPFDRGNDLFGFDPRTMEPVDRVISLSSFDTEIMGADGPVLARARPGRIARAGDTLVVGLARLFLAGTVQGIVAAPGRLALVQEGALVGSVQAPEGLQNCVRVSSVDAARVFVSCAGIPGQREEASGLFVYDVQQREVVTAYLPSQGDGPAVPFYAAALGPRRWVGVETVGDLDGSACADGEDRLWLIEDGLGAVRVLARGEGCSLTGLAYDSKSARLLVAAGSAGLRVFEGLDLSERPGPELPLPVTGVQRLELR